MRAFVTAVLGVVSATGVARAEETLALPHFVDETTSSGLTSTYQGEWQYMVGGGAAVFDCNGDGFSDVYLAGGQGRARLFENRSRQGGKLKFTRRKSRADLKGVTGAYPLDVDSDGRMDVVVLRVGESKVFRGLGKCRFEEANAKWKIDGGDAWTTAFSATWERGNAWPTFAFGSYIDRKFENEPWGHCTDNWLLRPNEKQDGFSIRTTLTPSYCALSMLFTDWNRSGVASLRVANDREYYQGGQEQLWKLPPGGKPQLYTADEGWRFQRLWGMGIASADINKDGLPEYMVTSMADQRLQFLGSGADKPNFKDAPFAMGTSAHRPFAGGDTRPSTGWHVQFEDVNNDSLYDIFIAKGNVDSMPDFAAKDPSNLLLQNAAGTFVEVADKADLLNFGRARGAAVADFNLDGKLDVMIVNRKENVRVWRNNSETLGNWLGLKLTQQGANRDGIGAWIEVDSGGKVQRREIAVGGGHVSGISGFWHFGMGVAAKAKVRVIWPGGPAGDWAPVNANGFHVLERGKSARQWQPGKPL
jgi:enediyne biosynthesis protein E4